MLLQVTYRYSDLGHIYKRERLVQVPITVHVVAGDGYIVILANGIYQGGSVHVTVHVVAGDRYSDPGYRYLDQGGSVQVPWAILHLSARSPICADWGGCCNCAGWFSGMLLYCQGTFLPALHGKLVTLKLPWYWKWGGGGGGGGAFYCLSLHVYTKRFTQSQGMAFHFLLHLISWPAHSCSPAFKVAPVTVEWRSGKYSDLRVDFTSGLLLF